MICVSLSCSTPERLLREREARPFIEVHLDALELTKKEYERVFGGGKRSVVTCRAHPTAGDRVHKYRQALRAGATYIDLDAVGDLPLLEVLRREIQTSKASLILSSHDYQGTPPLSVLHETISRCVELGADIVKIAATPHTPHELATLLSLYASHSPLISLGMGEVGRLSRVAAPLLGAPFTYASPREGESTGPGQYCVGKLREIYRHMGV